MEVQVLADLEYREEEVPETDLKDTIRAGMEGKEEILICNGIGLRFLKEPLMEGTSSFE
jgi:hypothetical protein